VRKRLGVSIYNQYILWSRVYIIAFQLKNSPICLSIVALYFLLQLLSTSLGETDSSTQISIYICSLTTRNSTTSYKFIRKLNWIEKVRILRLWWSEIPCVKMKIACLQFAPQLGKVQQNMEKANKIIESTTDLRLPTDGRPLWLVLPEMAFSGTNAPITPSTTSTHMT